MSERHEGKGSSTRSPMYSIPKGELELRDKLLAANNEDKQGIIDQLNRMVNDRVLHLYAGAVDK